MTNVAAMPLDFEDLDVKVMEPPQDFGVHRTRNALQHSGKSIKKENAVNKEKISHDEQS